MAKKIYIGGRLESVEQGNVVTGANAILDDTKGKKQNVINTETDAELLRLQNEKQNNLTFDNAPTENSNNPVTSGGVYAADQALQAAIEAILLLIPSAASALNKLVDEAQMNDKISTASATFRGTYTSVQALDNVQGDANDYAYVSTTDASGNSTYDKYKYVEGTGWVFEYTLNNNAFTATEWAAIQSGITAALVGKLSDLPTAEQLITTFAGKQDVLTFDNDPTLGSNNPVKSSGIKTELNTKQPTLVVGTNLDANPTEDSTNPVTSGGVWAAINAIAVKISAEASSSNQLADKAWVVSSIAAAILAAIPSFKGQFTSLADLLLVESPKAGDLGIVRTTDSDGYAVFTMYQFLNDTWNVFYTLSHHNLKKPATTGITGDYPYNGMGRVELAKNMVNTGTEQDPVYVNTLTQDMFYKGEVGSRVPNTNTIFVIQYDYELAENITVPENCVLEFDGGSLNSNTYKVICTNTTIDGILSSDSLSVLFGNYSIVKIEGTHFFNKDIVIVTNEEELSSILTSGNTYETILLKKDLFVLPSQIRVNVGGTIMPYPGYKGELIVGKAFTDVVSSSENGVTFRRDNFSLYPRLFRLFDEFGNNLKVQRLSDYLNVDTCYTHNITVESGTNIMKIPMEDSVKAVLANKDASFFKNSTLLLKSWFFDVQGTDIHTDSDYIYATKSDSTFNSYLNYDVSSYGASNTRYDIYNVPLDGNGACYIDGNDILHSPFHFNSVIWSTDFLFILESAKHLKLYGLTFKGGFSHTIAIALGASNKEIDNCKFRNCFKAIYSPINATNIRICECMFDDMGDAGVEINGNVSITRCHFKNIGQVLSHCFAIDARRSNNVIANNIIESAPQGIRIGDADLTSPNSAVVTGNIIDNKDYLNKSEKYLLLDVGAIYVSTVNSSVTISENVIRNYTSRICPNMDPRGIFLDDGAYNVTCTDNIIYNIYCLNPSMCNAIDSRRAAIDGYPDTNKNNVVANNICFGGVKVEGNPDAPTSTKCYRNLIDCYHRLQIKDIDTLGTPNQFTKLNINGSNGNLVASDCFKGFVGNKKYVEVSKDIYTSKLILGDYTFDSYGTKQIRFKLSKTPNAAFSLRCTFRFCIFSASSNVKPLWITVPLSAVVSNSSADLMTDFVNSPVNSERLNKIKISNTNSYSDDYLYLCFEFKVSDYTRVEADCNFEEPVLNPQSPLVVLDSDTNTIADSDVVQINVIQTSGATADRPTNLTSKSIGFKYFDTSLGNNGKPIWFAGKVNNADIWVDATGMAV